MDPLNFTLLHTTKHYEPTRKLFPMSSKAVIEKMFDHHYWATAKVLERAVDVSETDYFAQFPSLERSLHDVLFHALRAENNWVMGLATGEPPVRLQPENYPTLAAVQAEWQAQEQRTRAFLATLDDESIMGDGMMSDYDEDPSPITRWYVLNHLILHAHQHRSEAALLLTQYGTSPGELDFIYYVMPE